MPQSQAAAIPKHREAEETDKTSERANLSAFRTFVRFVLVWICRFLLPLGVWEGLRFVIVALPGLFLTFFQLNLTES